MLNLSDKISLKRSEKDVPLSNLSIYTWKNIKKLYRNKFKMSAPTWKGKLELLDRSYSISNIKDYFEYIIKKHATLT